MPKEQNQSHEILVSLEDRILSPYFMKVGYYLSTLHQYFPAGTPVSQDIAASLNALKKLNHMEELRKNSDEVWENLKKELLNDLIGIRKSLKDYDEDQPGEIREILKKVDTMTLNSSLREEQGLFSWFREEAGKDMPSSESLEFDQILQMINAASECEPEWMLRTGTLLVLDNNANTAEALGRRLIKHGHNILTAENDLEASSFLKSHHVETLLIDYQTIQDGLHPFLEKLEHDPAYGYIPVIVIGLPESTVAMNYILEAGRGDYLAKPVNSVLLRARVQTALEKKYAYEQKLERLKDMQQSRLKLESAIQDLPDGYAIFDKDNRMIMNNDRLFEFYPNLKNRQEMMRGGLTFEKIIEANLTAGVYHLENRKEGSRRKWLEEKKADFMLPASQWEEVLTNGIALGITTFRSPDGGAALIAKDISKDKAQRQDLTFMAYHDVLTGLPNRKAFHQKLGQSIISAQNSPHDMLAILFLDLDHFKAVNDTHGHEMGDWVLNQVAQRLHGCVRGDDTIARFGGDEFCIILNHVANRTKIEMVASRIIKSISEPYIRQGISMTIGVSIGIGIYSAGTENGEALLKAADEAMYFVKEHGKGQFRFQDENLAKGRALLEPVPAEPQKDGHQNAD